jgi:5'-3' exoribonuclease 2
VDILREYLEAELFVPGLTFPFDLERAIDDWVFMCFFVGNDFLPHLPSLDIRENAIDTLISIWKNCMGRMGGYVTCDGNVNLARAQIILEGLGQKEDAIFQRRHQRITYLSLSWVNMIEDERQKENAAARKRQNQTLENHVPENFPTSDPTQTQPLATPPSKRRKSDIPPAPIPDLMAPSAIQSSTNVLPGAQGAAGKAISQTNRDIVANRKALRMGGNPPPQPNAMAENKSAADALRKELGLGPAPPVTDSTPISAKAALKRKAAVMEENENTDTDYSAPATPIPKTPSGAVEDVKDTVR